MTPDADDPLFEITQVRGQPSDDAIAVGRLADLMTPMPGSLGREQLAEAAQELLEFAAEHQQHAARLQQIEASLADTKANLRQIIDDFCGYFSEMKARQDAEAKRQARAEARKRIGDSLPDPDAPTGKLPAPSLQPDLRASDPGQYPDNDGLTYDAPAELPRDPPRSADHISGDLPEDVALPSPVGSYAVWSSKDLRHPQESPPTQAAVGGP